MTTPLWQLTDVRLGLPTNARLQAELIEISTGVTAVLGESGAGKTSLLNLLVGFETSATGTVQRPTEASNSSSLAWVPADFGLWSPLTVQEHLTSVIPSTVSNVAIEVASWLKRFDLEALAGQRPETLSMGERSRLAVARALATGANVLVMDEPLVHVDSMRLPHYWRMIRETLQQRNGSLVFSTHSPELVLREAEHVLCLSQGRVVWQGSVDTLYAHPPTQELAFALGHTNWLEPLSAATWLGKPVDSEIHLRPEHLLVCEQDDGPFIVEQSVSIGTLAQSELVALNSQERRTFYHQASSEWLKPGTRVTLKVFLASLFFVLALTLPGCQQSNGEEPELKFTEISHHTLPAEGAMLPAPRGMTYSPEGELFVLDNAGRMIVYDAQGKFSRKWWMPEYSVGKPEGAWVLLDGRVAIADTHYHRVLFFDQQGGFLGSFGENGTGPGQFIYVIAVTQDPHGFLYVAENGGNDRIQKFTADGTYVTSIGACGTEPGEFQRPSGIVWDNGELYVADAINNRIQVFKDDGTFIKIIADSESAGLYYPYDIAQAPDGTLFLPEYGAGRISQVSKEGVLLGRYGREGRGLGQFWTPWGIAISSHGAVAVADTGNRRIVEMHLTQFKHLKPKMSTKKVQEVSP